MLFSRRNGYLPAQKAIQRESLDDETRNGLWNVILLLFRDPLVACNGKLIDLYTAIWIDFFKEAADTVPQPRTCTYNTPVEQKFIECYKNFFFSAEWMGCFDFLEFIVSYVNSNHWKIYRFKGDPKEAKLSDIIALQKKGCSEDEYSQFVTLSDDSQGICFVDVITSQSNKVLEEECSAYRFVDNYIVEITSEIERQEIGDAISESKDPVCMHLKKALEHLSSRENPDYPNSVKESITAVESLCCVILANPKASLGEALQIVEKKYPLHGSLKEAFKKLYGYTSDAGGIRHGGIDFADVDYDLAKYMLVSCSAFINYLRVICEAN